MARAQEKPVPSTAGLWPLPNALSAKPCLPLQQTRAPEAPEAPAPSLSSLALGLSSWKGRVGVGS